MTEHRRPRLEKDLFQDSHRQQYKDSGEQGWKTGWKKRKFLRIKPLKPQKSKFFVFFLNFLCNLIDIMFNFIF